MSTYNPPVFPRRPSPKERNPIAEFRYQLQLAYYRYEINTGLYVMSPGEKLAYNLILLALLAFFLSSVWYYFPYTVKYSVGRLLFYMTGTQPVRRIIMAGVTDGSVKEAAVGRTVQEVAQATLSAAVGAVVENGTMAVVVP